MSNTENLKEDTETKSNDLELTQKEKSNEKTFEIEVEENAFELTTLDITLNNTNNDSTLLNYHNQTRSLEKQVLNEQEKYAKLQEKYQLSEKQRLELISQTNKETFTINTQYAKLRSEFEKNEAIRQTLEYELSLAKSSFNKEKQLALDKERTLEEITKHFQGI